MRQFALAHYVVGRLLQHMSLVEYERMFASLQLITTDGYGVELPPFFHCTRRLRVVKACPTGSLGSALTTFRRLRLSEKIKRRRHRTTMRSITRLSVGVTSVSQVTAVYQAQRINYLHSAGLKLGFIVNFHGLKATWQRFVM